MKTQIELAREGVFTEQMQAVANDENMDAALIRKRVANGQIVIPNNPFRQGQKGVGIGRGLSTKVNASIETSSDICDIDMEVFNEDIAGDKCSS
jgi:phosphomethylpyrimidine synthase